MIQSIKKLLILAALMSVNITTIASDSLAIPKQWSELKSILISRQEQPEQKMKLSPLQVKNLVSYLNTHQADEFRQLQKLKQKLPKTTLELLFAVEARGLNKEEAEKMAAYLRNVPTEYHIKNVAAFDENTSHIIGREWHEIDYANEGMTWQGQKAKYASYGITNFKSVDNLKRFFPVESKMPYFYKAYN